MQPSKITKIINSHGMARGSVLITIVIVNVKGSSMQLVRLVKDVKIACISVKRVGYKTAFSQLNRMWENVPVTPVEEGAGSLFKMFLPW